MGRNYAHQRRSQRLIEARASQKRLQSANASFGVTQGASPSSILALPNETLLSIKNHLAISWQLSLALTCKSLKVVLLPGSTLPRLEKEDLAESLLALSKDIPNVYFCFCCNKLRPLNSEADWDGQNHRWTVGNMKNSRWTINNYKDTRIWFSQPFFTFMRVSDIHFMNAHLIMKGYLYGQSHGIPLQSLEKSATYEEYLTLDRCRNSSSVHSPACIPQNGIFKPTLDVGRRRKNAWRFSSQSVPKIVDGRLYIARFLTIVGPLVRWEYFARLIQSVRPGICQHLECSAPPQGFCRHSDHMLRLRVDRRLFIASLMGGWQNTWEGFNSENFNPEKGSCLLCATDYDMSLKQDKTKEEWNFTLSTYHCLGSCRTPDAQLWAYFTSSFLNTFNPSQSPETSLQLEELKSRHLKLDRGGARRIWHETT